MLHVGESGAVVVVDAGYGGGAVAGKPRILIYGKRGKRIVKNTAVYRVEKSRIVFAAPDRVKVKGCEPS